MPELPPPTVWAQLRRMALLSVGALSLHAFPVCASAQTVPASLRACTAESDPGRRLACYDRAMARLTAPTRASRAAMPSAAAPDALSREAPAPAQTPAVPQEPAAAPAVPPTPAPAPAVSAPRESAPPPAPADTPATHRGFSWKSLVGGGASSHLTAHITRLERWPDAMVLHLDNGQVWQQIGRASGDLGLRVGDKVTIDRHLGSYWLSSRHVSNMQVRLKPH